MKTIISLTMAMVLFLPFTASAATGSKQAFSADLFYQDAGRRERKVMRAYFSPGSVRMERIPKGNGIGIVRFDRNVVWALNVRRKLYREYPLDAMPQFHPMDLDGTTLKRTILGRERRNGVICNKVRVRYEVPRSGRSKIATAWYGKDLGIYVRIENSDGSVLDLRNIRFGPQPDHLFEIPRRYRLGPAPAAPGRPDLPPGPHAAYGPPWFGRPPWRLPYPQAGGRTGISVLEDRRLFHNSDFEDGTLHNWTTDGDAFRYQPTKADNPTARRSRQPSRHQKNYWIGTYEKYGARTRERPGRIQGDRPTGTLTSTPFVITHERIEFLIGGGNRPSDTYVGLLINGKVVRKASGRNSETMGRHTWHVRQYAGQKARIVIVDKATRRWGHINADDFRYNGRALLEVRVMPSRTRYEHGAAH